MMPEKDQSKFSQLPLKVPIMMHGNLKASVLRSNLTPGPLSKGEEVTHCCKAVGKTKPYERGK